MNGAPGRSSGGPGGDGGSTATVLTDDRDTEASDVLEHLAS